MTGEHSVLNCSSEYGYPSYPTCSAHLMPGTWKNCIHGRAQSTGFPLFIRPQNLLLCENVLKEPINFNKSLIHFYFNVKIS